MDAIVASSSLAERQKLSAIGAVVASCLEDLKSPIVPENQCVKPSILPIHDNQTINFLAAMERRLRSSNMPEPVQAEILERLEREALVLQRDERSS